MDSTYHVAQTNTQLYIQLQSLGYDRKSLKLIRNAYECAMVLFNCHFRHSGKPFICHLVGTASVLASLRLSSELVIAGLLHAAYEIRYPTGSDLPRNDIRKTFGEKVDQLICSYTQFSLDENSILYMSQNLRVLPDSQKTNILMRLANEVDNHLDLGMYYSERDYQKVKKLEKLGSIYLDLAESLNYPLLVDYIRDTLQRNMGAPSPPHELRRTAEVHFGCFPLSIILLFIFGPLIKFLRHRVLKKFLAPPSAGGTKKTGKRFANG